MFHVKQAQPTLLTIEKESHYNVSRETSNLING